MKLNRLMIAVSLPILLVSVAGCNFNGIFPPILVSERESLLDKGMVFLVTNTSDKPLHGVSVEVSVTNGTKHSYYRHTIEAHDTFEVGWLELNKWQPPIHSVVDVSVVGYVMAEEYQ